jgi:hypothetical protein
MTPMGRERWMALLFAAGSLCFLVAPFPGYLELAGPEADGLTFFVGSVLFTGGGALQLSLSRPWAAAWWAAAIQSAGTLYFNVTTFRALDTALTSPTYDALVWRPDAVGSACFLISGAIVYWTSPRRGPLPRRVGHGWWEPAVNLLGCVFFGIAAVAGYVVPSQGSMLDLAAANWNTAAGAACFAACAVATLLSGHTMKAPRLERVLHDVERVL